MNKQASYRLGDIATFVNGRAYSMPEMLHQGKYRIVRVGNFTGKDEWYYSDLELDADKYCENGDLLYKWACTFGPEIWSEEKAIYHYHIWKVIPNDKYIDKDFLYYLLRSMTSQWLKTAHGSTMIHITKEIMENNVVTIPKEVSVQHKIAKVLKTIDEKITNNNAACVDLEAMAKLLYDYWFVQFDFPDENGKPYKSSGGKMVWNEELKREIPEGWEVKTLDDIAEMYQPKTFDAKLLEIDGEYCVYGAGGYMGQYHEYNHENSEVFISCRGSCGNIYKSMPKSLITGNAMIVHPYNEEYKEYLYWSLVRFGVKNCITGSVQPQITRKELSQWKMVIPNKENIIKFNKIASQISETNINATNENQRLASLRDFLLPMLMNGQVRVKGN